MEAINKPKHYDGQIECIECIKASMTRKQYIGFLKGNIIKYVWRFERKNKLEDIEKMQVYSKWLEKEYA